MDILPAVPKISSDDLLAEIKKEYTDVAQYPHKGYHFHTGREAAGRLGYDPSPYLGIPEENISSFAGTGNPFMLGPIKPGSIVIDAGSGSGFDSLIAAKLVGIKGRIYGIDMTREMLDKARSGAKKMGIQNVEFLNGLVDNLPLPDNSADVLISNGVLNLSLNKTETLKEWNRVLKPGGDLYIGDILISKALPEEALDDISLWTG